MKFLKLIPDAAGLSEINGEITVLANEDGTLSYMQHYAVKTGVAISIDEGKVALLVETQSMGTQGVSVCGKCVTDQDMGELRIGLHNLSRTAYQFKKGEPICRLILVEAPVGTLEECDDEDEWTLEMQDRHQKAREDKSEADTKLAEEKSKADAKSGESGSKKGYNAKQENMIPKGSDVSEGNASKNANLNPGGVLKPIPGVQHQGTDPASTKTPATV